MLASFALIACTCSINTIRSVSAISSTVSRADASSSYFLLADACEVCLTLLSVRDALLRVLLEVLEERELGAQVA
jgi:hypothetical protein